MMSFAVASLAIAQKPEGEFVKRPLPARPAKVAPLIDGDLGDEAWKEAPKAEIFVDRVTGNVAPDQTRAYILYDEKFIYVAYDCIESEPTKIEARETIRDSKYAGLQNGDSPNKEDNVTFAIDPYFSMRPGDVSAFSVNAIGTPSANISGGRGNKIEWKGEWTSAAKRTPTGYCVEMRIPWRMLNYPASRHPRTIGINFHRYQYRTKTETIWSNVTTHSFTDLEGRWQEVNVPQAAFKPSISVLPYVLPGVVDDKFTNRVGVDARVAITPDVTAVGSLNPDFGTIEGAVESIAFSRSERYVPDRRPFFLDGGDFFSPGTRFNDIGAYFYSGRVKTFDVGTKLYGKITPRDSVGFLNTTTFGDRVDTVVRYRHDLAPNSDVGVFASQKTAPGDHSSVLMVDQHARFGAYGVESQFATTSGENAGGGAAVLSGFYQAKNNTTLLQYHTISKDFRISNGYIPYSDYHGYFAFTDWNGTWKSGGFRNYDYGFYGIGWDHQDGSRYQRGFGSFANVVSKSDWRYSVSQDYNVIDGTIDSTVDLRATMGQSNRFRRIGLGITTGRFADQPATFITPSASFRLFKKVDLAYSGSLLNLQGTTQQHIFTAGYDLSPTKSIGGRLVSQDSNTNWYAFFRNSGGHGTNYYVVVGDPNARRFSKQVQVKFVFSF